ncbi:GNAT family N-acetyltransferase [Dyadobacter sandarakinus]|uniref:GNAT family N-acetyltransferase n=1 Tax=Dyadobacter sandarakinus TaxID=2747268 RepID=A0ABX7I7Z1_9BACT|nr:GNAT family N-acetyltransferase [Dyadobacter sandarakinus]QRR01101.1 GNAT family N-acetyltransferase [Dyadobacter sandarakinus]
MLNVNFVPFPKLQTQRLTLLRLEPVHAGDVFRLRSNAEAMKYIGKSLLNSRDEAARLIEAYSKGLNENAAITWGIVLSSDRRSPIGTIGFHTIDKSNHRAEIGYMIHPDYWNQGLMKEAVDRVISYGFDTLGLHSIEAKIHPENTASERLLLKLGFVKEAYFRESFYFEGKFQDTVVFSLISTR